MQRKIFIAALLALYSFTFTSAQTSIAKWQTQPLIIDGNDADWGGMPRFFNAESNIKYEFRNDSQYLYLILKPADISTQIQQTLAGFSVKLRLKNTSVVKMGINFPAIKRADIPPMDMENRTKLVDKSISKPETSIKDTAILDGFQFTNGIITSDKSNDNSICFSHSKSRRELGVYEIRIPLREIFGDNFRMDIISTTDIQLQVSTNEISQKEASRMRSDMHSGGGRGMRGEGMRGGGQMGGEMQGGEMGEMPGGEMGDNAMQSGMRAQLSMERKSFSKDFTLSNGK